MDEDELEKLKEKKKEELKEGGAGEQQEKMKEEMEKKRKQELRKVLTKDAMERLGRVRLANEQLASQLETYLVRLSQAGQIKNKVTEDKLKQILKSVKEEQKKDWKIRRK